MSRRSGIALLGLLSHRGRARLAGGWAAAAPRPTRARRRSCLRARRSTSRSTPTKARTSGRSLKDARRAVPRQAEGRRLGREQPAARTASLDYRKDIEPALGPEIDFAWLDLNGQRRRRRRSHATEERLGIRAAGGEGQQEGSDEQAPVRTSRRLGGHGRQAQTMIDRFKAESKAAPGFLADDDSFTRRDEGRVQRRPAPGVRQRHADRGRHPPAGRARRWRSVVDRAGKLDWVVAGVGASPDGIRFDAVVRGTPGKLLHGNGGQVLFHPKLPSSVPADTIVYFSFHGSKNMLSGLDKGIPQLAQKDMTPLRKLIREPRLAARGRERDLRASAAAGEQGSRDHPARRSGARRRRGLEARPDPERPEREPEPAALRADDRRRPGPRARLRLVQAGLRRGRSQARPDRRAGGDPGAREPQGDACRRSELHGRGKGLGPAGQDAGLPVRERPRWARARRRSSPARRSRTRSSATSAPSARPSSMG